MHTRENIIHLLAKHHQRATYSALAGLLGMVPRSVMSGLPKDSKNSWIVAKENGLPSGYSTEAIDSRLSNSGKVIETVEEL